MYIGDRFRCLGDQISGGVHLGNECRWKWNGSSMTFQICRCKVTSLWTQSERALSQLYCAVFLVVIAAVFAKLWIKQIGSIIFGKFRLLIWLQSESIFISKDITYGVRTCDWLPFWVCFVGDV